MFEMPMRKIWKRNSSFYKSAYVGWDNSHFSEELGCQHCMPGKFWTWSVSLGHPVLLIQQQRWNTRARITVILGEGQRKAAQLCIQTWINSIIVIQISPAIDQQYLCLKLICLSCQVKAVYCVSPLKSQRVSVALYVSLVSQLKSWFLSNERLTLINLLYSCAYRWRK